MSESGVQDVEHRQPIASIRLPQRLFAGIGIPLVFRIDLIAWGYSSPVSASPDDDFHLSSTWCGLGDRGDYCQPGTEADAKTIPLALVAGSNCYIQKATISAGCQEAAFRADQGKTISTTRGNFAGLYPPLFYAVAGTLVTPDIEVSVLLMRILNAVLFVGLVSAAFFALPASRRATLIVPVVATIVPLGMFLVPSNNPSSWAILSAVVGFSTLRGFLLEPGRRKLPLAIIAVVAGLMGAGARADAAIYLAIGTVIAVVTSLHAVRDRPVRLLVPGVLLVIAAGFYLTASQVDIASGGLGTTDRPLFPLIFQDFIDVPALWVQAVSSSNLGWLDTPTSGITVFCGMAVFSALLFSGLREMWRTKGISLLLLGAAAWIIPWYVLVKSGAIVGEQVQPRYLLPLLILIVAVAFLHRTGGTLSNISNLQVFVILAAVVISNSAALHSNIRRYVTGTDAYSFNLNTAVEWWWNIPVSPMAVWIIGSAALAITAFALGLVFAKWRTVGADDVTPVEAIPVST